MAVKKQTKTKEYPIPSPSDWILARERILELARGKSTFDPISFPLRYNNPKDQEVVGLLASLYSYGRVASILNFLERLFSILGDSPHTHILEGKDPSYWKSFQKQIQGKLGPYRFQTEEDHIEILTRLSYVYNEKNCTWETTFSKSDSSFANSKLPPLFFAIQSFQKSLLQPNPSLSNGVRFALGVGNFQIPPKRILMFLRWMIRDKEPDLGIYKTWKPSELFFPVDVHIARMAKLFFITEKKSIHKYLSQEVTEYFRKIDSEDPVSFDYALTRIGIAWGCRGKLVEDICGNCVLRSYCREGRLLVVPRGIEPRLQG